MYCFYTGGKYMSLNKPDYSLHEDQTVLYLQKGTRRLFTNPDTDEARAFFRTKNRRMVNKVTTVKEAVTKYVKDGDYLRVGGFGTNRIPTAVLHEIVRQQKKDLGFAGHTSTHDMQILIAVKCISRCDVAYIVRLEARGLSKISRNAFQSGEVEPTEWTNAALAWRYKAAAMGLSFIPARSVLGADTLKYSAAVEIPCPFTGKRYVALPALYPDVACIHVHRCDIYGNAQIDGISVSDPDLARAAKRLIITTERLVSTEEIRRKPDQTVIPYYLADAVIEVPYGAYPSNMAYEYFTDEDHIKEWLHAEKTEEALQEPVTQYDVIFRFSYNKREVRPKANCANMKSDAHFCECGYS
jgi:glutaconate CoA-transferase subunit A